MKIFNSASVILARRSWNLLIYPQIVFIASFLSSPVNILPDS